MTLRMDLSGITLGLQGTSELVVASEQTAATSVGMTVAATAGVLSIDDQTVHFRVVARDDVEDTGSGTHTRVVVNIDRFDQSVNGKLAQQADRPT